MGVVFRNDGLDVRPIKKI